MGEPFRWNAARAKPGRRQYQQFAAESKIRMNDGEMPWGRDKTFQKGYVDGKSMLEDCAAHSLSTLSLAHNYRENQPDCGYTRWADGPMDPKEEYNMIRWQKELAAKEEKRGFSVNPDYFSGCTRSVFQVLRDHLGYQLQIADARLAETGLLQYTIRNSGFALPYNFRGMEVCLLQEGSMKKIPIETYTPEQLQGGQEAAYRLPVDAPVGTRIGLRIYNRNCPLLSIRFANQTEFSDGIQWLGTIE